jgi:C4-dicarboxylate transporter, DctM subunit
MVALIVCLILVALMVIGMPVCIAMGLTSAGAMQFMDMGWLLSTMTQKIYQGSVSYTLIAIPFFILAGNLMNSGGITDRIFNFANAMVGHWPGGLGQVNVMSSVIFSGMSGAAVADAAGLGSIEIKAMNDAGYDEKFSAAITAASSTIGPVIPPSIPFVVYAAVSSASVPRLFAAGFIPGLLMAVAMMICVYFISKKRKYPVGPRMPWGIRLKALWQAIPSLTTIVIIVGGILSGFFMPTEAAIVATFYAFFLSFVVYRKLTFKKLMDVIYQSILTSCKTLFIIAVASFMSWFLIYNRIPDIIINGLLSVTTAPSMLILIIIFILLVLGMFLEGTSVILIVTPIFLPIVNQIGMDQVQFGVIITLASMVGLLTPPVGMSLYAVCSITKVELLDLSKAVLPYVAGIIVVLLLCAYWAPLSMWIPSLIWGG